MEQDSVLTSISTVAVLGGGTMGAGIAAQAANAGLEVILLDLERPIAAEAREALLERRPPPLMDAAFVERIRCGSFDEDLHLLAQADWIVEVIVERAEPKRALFERVEAVRKDGSIVSSNTSGIQLAELVDGMPERFVHDFCITHFFNPPRYMGLLELVSGSGTARKTTQRMTEFCTAVLGKEVVHAKDTPCFIGNRIGVAAIMAGLHKALEHGLDVEVADAVAGRPAGLPGTGIFGLIDLIGLDVIAQICSNLDGQLPADDPARAWLELPTCARTLLERGWIGRKAGAGFYRQSKDEQGNRVREVLDLESLEYRPARKVTCAAAGLRAPDELFASDDPEARFAADFLAAVLGYSAAVGPVIADDIRAIDTAMREGYAWKWGPFELLDRIGAAAVRERWQAPVPKLLETTPLYEPGRHRAFDGSWRDDPVESGVMTVAGLRAGNAPVYENAAATLHDAGDGAALLEFHTKMNALDEFSVEAMREAQARLEGRFSALVIGSDASHFSAGANLRRMVDAAEAGDFAFLENFIAGLQNALMAFKYAPYPVVAAARGLALGGGCEVLLHADAVQGHADMSAGLVELRVGLLPAGGGTKELLLRHSARHDLRAGALQALELIGAAVTSASAAHARHMGILAPQDGITMHPRRVLADARARALELVPGYAAPQPAAPSGPWPKVREALAEAIEQALAAQRYTAHDAAVAGHVAAVLGAGDAADEATVPEQRLLDLEREHFLALLDEPLSRDRIQHMLKTGKPLRN